ncbi:MAG: flagellar basal body L-ring protein FlgH [Ignavibacteriae bacterium]|nr:flagellar basal body L-ring protein FlgH [Ignavibacteriota bacterium]
MKKFIIISITAIWICCFYGMDAVYAQFIQNSARSLFSDVKAFKVGDAIMVLIMEDTQADNSATTSDGRSTDLSGGVDFSSGSSGFNGSGGLNTGTSFKGQGQTQRKEKIRSRLSARVMEVDDNGNLKIEGTRNTRINGENQKIVIKGFVRPVDVLPNNSIYSYSILDLTLEIWGEGSVSKYQEPGLISSFLRFLF